MTEKKKEASPRLCGGEKLISHLSHKKPRKRKRGEKKSAKRLSFKAHRGAHLEEEGR